MNPLASYYLVCFQRCMHTCTLYTVFKNAKLSIFWIFSSWIKASTGAHLFLILFEQYEGARGKLSNLGRNADGEKGLEVGSYTQGGSQGHILKRKIKIFTINSQSVRLMKKNNPIRIMNTITLDPQTSDSTFSLSPSFVCILMLRIRIHARTKSMICFLILS